MGVDIGFYIQKNVDNKWKDVSLYKDNSNKVEIWRRGSCVTDEVIDCYTFGLNVNHDEIVDLAISTGWLNNDGNDDEMPPYYAISLSKLKYLANKPGIDIHDTEEEYIDKKKFFKELVNEIEVYLSFTDDDYIDEDNIRIIAFISY